MPIYTPTTGTDTIWPTWARQTFTASSYTGTTGGVWDAWSDQYSITSGTTTATINQIVWGRWQPTASITITGGTTAATDWAFNNRGAYTAAASATFARWVGQHAETKEQEAARLAAEAERQRIWEAGEPERAAQRERAAQAAAATLAKRQGAHRRAMELLYLVLSTSQKKMLEEKRFFLVDAPSGRCYRIDQGNHANVKVVDKATGNILETLCVQPDGLPDGDVMLIQKLLIETAEQAFRDTANISEWGTYRRISSSKHMLTGDKLAEILQFPQGGRKADFGELVAAVEAVAEEQAAERAAAERAA